MSTSGEDQNETALCQVDELIDKSGPASAEETPSTPPLVDTEGLERGEQDTDSSQPSDHNYPLAVSAPNVEVEFNPILNIFETRKPRVSSINVPNPFLSFVEHKMRKRSICLPRDKPPSKKKCTKKPPEKSKVKKSDSTTTETTRTVTSTKSSSSLAKSKIGDSKLVSNSSNTPTTATNPLTKIVATSNTSSTPTTPTNPLVNTVPATILPTILTTPINPLIKSVPVANSSKTPTTAINPLIKIVAASNPSSTLTTPSNPLIKTIPAATTSNITTTATTSLTNKGQVTVCKPQTTTCSKLLAALQKTNDESLPRKETAPSTSVSLQTCSVVKSDATTTKEFTTVRKMAPIPTKELEKIITSGKIKVEKLAKTRTLKNIKPKPNPEKAPKLQTIRTLRKVTLIPELKTVRLVRKITPDLTKASLESETLYIMPSTIDKMNESTASIDTSTITTDPLSTATDPIGTPMTLNSSSTPTNSLINKGRVAISMVKSPLCTVVSKSLKTSKDTVSKTSTITLPSTSAPSSLDELEPNLITFVDINKVKMEPCDNSNESHTATKPSEQLESNSVTFVDINKVKIEPCEILNESHTATKPSTGSSIEPNSITFVDINKVKIVPSKNQAVEKRIGQNKAKCLKCVIPFKNLREVQLHMKSVHSSELPCIKCATVFQSREQLLDHLMGVHHICVICQLQFLTRKSFSSHHAEHSEGHVYIYQCTMCHNQERTYSSIQRHIQLNHRLNLLRRDSIVENYRKNIPLLKLYTDIELKKKNAVQCNYCLMLFKPDKLQSHYKFSHYIINCENCNALLSLSQKMPDYFEVLPVKCTYCGFKFEIGKGDSKLFNMDKPRLQMFDEITTHECKHCFKYFTTVPVKNAHELDCPCNHKNHGMKMNFELGINTELSSMFLCELPCMFCDKYVVYADLVKHLTEVHHYCGVCDETFETQLQFEMHRNAHEEGKVTHVTCNVCFLKFPHKQLQNHFDKFHPFALVRERFLKRVSVEIPVFDTTSMEMLSCAFCFGIFRKSCDFEEHLRRRHHIYCCIVCKYFAYQPSTEPDSTNPASLEKIPVARSCAKTKAGSQSKKSNDSSLSTIDAPTTSNQSKARSKTKNTSTPSASSSLSTNESTSSHENDKPRTYTYSQLVASLNSNDPFFEINDMPSTSCNLSLNNSTNGSSSSLETNSQSANVYSQPTTCNEYEFINIKQEPIDDDNFEETNNPLAPESSNEYEFLDIKQEIVEHSVGECETDTNIRVDQESSFNQSESNVTDGELPAQNSRFNKRVKVDELEMKGKSKKLFKFLSSPVEDDLNSDDPKSYSFVDVNELIMDSSRTSMFTKNKEHKCLKCELNFKYRTRFVDHIKTIHSFDLPCTLCDVILTKREDMMEHLTYTHHVCVPCRLQFPDEHSLLEHKNEHDNNRVYLYRCCQCGLIVTSFSTIQRHLQTIHRQLSLQMDYITKCLRKDVAILKVYSDEELKAMFKKQCDYCLKLLTPDKAALHYKYFHYIIRCGNCKCIVQLPKYFKTSVNLSCDYCEYQIAIDDLVSCKFLFRQGKGYQKFENIKTYECRHCFRYFPNVAQKNDHEIQCPCNHKHHEIEIESLPKTDTGCVNDTENIWSYVVPCIFCKKYIKYHKLADHLMKVHKFCGVCGDSFPQFEEHKNLHQTNKIQHLTCTRCFINYPPKKMITHVQKFHASAISNKTIFKTVTVNIPEFKLDSSIVCAICYGNFSMLCDFEEHLRRRHNIFSCVECRYFILQDVPDS